MVKSRSQYSLINILSGAFSQALIVLLNFVSRTVFIHLLPVEYLGIQGLFTNVLTVLSFAELGIGEAMVYALYKPMKMKDTLKLTQLMKLYQKAYQFVAIIVFSAGVICSFFLDEFIDAKPDIPENLQFIFLLFVINTAVSYLFSYKKSILLVDQKRFIVTASHQLFVTLQVVLQIIFLYLTKDYITYLLIQIFCTLGDNMLVSWYVNKTYPYICQKPAKPLSHTEGHTIFENVKALALSRISGVVSNGCTNIIISKLLGLAMVGIASNYLLIVNAVNGVLWTGLTGISGSLGNFNVDASAKDKQRVFDQLFLFSFWIYCCACVSLFTLLNPFIHIWIGDAFLLPESVAFVIVWIIYIGGVNYPAYSFRTTLGYFVQVKYIFFFGAILNVILSIIGGMYFGLIGIFLGTPISRLLTTEIADGYYVFKWGLKTSPMLYYQRYIKNFLIYLICCFVASLGVNYISNDGIIGFVLKTVVSLLITNVILFIVFRKNESFQSLLNRIGKIVKR